jgi:hypothetical protein
MSYVGTNMRQRSIAVTIFGMLNVGFGLLGIVVAAAFLALSANPSVVDSPIMKQMPVTAWTKVSTLLEAVASVALIAAGVGLLLSRNWGRTLSIACGIFSVLLAMGCFAAAISGGVSAMGVVMAAANLFVTMAYPVLLIIFMTRPNVVAALKPLPPSA